MVVPGIGDAFHAGQQHTGYPPVALAACVLVLLEFLRMRHAPKRIPGLLALCTALRLTVVVLLLDAVVGTMVLPAPLITSSLAAGEIKLSPSWEDQEVVTGDGKATLNLGVLDRGFHHWTVVASPNGVRFEQMSDFLLHYSRATKRNILAFNYRGVGQSTGSARSSYDLLDDGRAAAAWLFKHKKPDPERVLFHGWSLGGPVALHLKALYPGACVVSDRSFSSLAAVGQHMFRENRLFGGAVGAMLVGAGAAVVPGTVSAALTGSLVGGLVGAAGGFTPLVPSLLKALHWEMDGVKQWTNAKCATDRRCIVLYHEHDGVIDWESASLHAAVASDDDSGGAQFVRLNHTFARAASNHMFSFPAPAAKHWNGLLHAIQSACGE
jgi:pimeloyl-ACP methyl ester carboxylesterase